MTSFRFTYPMALAAVTAIALACLAALAIFGDDGGIEPRRDNRGAAQETLTGRCSMGSRAADTTVRARVLATTLEIKFDGRLLDLPNEQMLVGAYVTDDLDDQLGRYQLGMRQYIDQTAPEPLTGFIYDDVEGTQTAIGTAAFEVTPTRAVGQWPLDDMPELADVAKLRAFVSVDGTDVGGCSITFH